MFATAHEAHLKFNYKFHKSILNLCKKLVTELNLKFSEWLSNSTHGSLSFLIPKSDTAVPPWWVNDYWVVNLNTILDLYPLPWADDILANCAKGCIRSCLDMMNSFFQTWVHPDDVHLTAIMTPFGLYEWTVMPQGLKNITLIHQWRMNAPLCHLIRKTCHIYIDDIMIWSSSIAEHVRHIHMPHGHGSPCQCQIVLQ